MENSVKNENRLAKMEQKLDNLIDDVKELSNDIKSLDNKYSGKWVEKLTIGIAGGMIVAIAAAVITLLMNKGG